MNEQLEGVLPIHKPAGWTSHDVVAKMRRVLGMKRIGHTGTLDPDVTGVLPLCLNKATRFVEYLQERPKTYEAELTVGYATDTEDASGAILEQSEHIYLTQASIEQAIQPFTGTIRQVPPMYSAVKYKGKKLYELARQGIEIEREAREVVIHRLTLLSAELTPRFPRIRFEAVCSKGTYIRTLCVDIGRKLGYPAVMSQLVRKETAGISLERCLTIEEVEQRQMNGTLTEALIPADEAVSFIPKLVIEQSLACRAAQGQRIRLQLQERIDTWSTDALVRLYDERGLFYGIYSLPAELSVLQPVKVFLPTSR